MSAFSNFTDKIKNKIEGIDDGDDLETMSIRTDTSEDDFEHLSLDDQEEVPAFFHEPPPLDSASLADSEQIDSVSVYAESTTTKGKEMVSVSKSTQLLKSDPPDNCHLTVKKLPKT